MGERTQALVQIENKKGQNICSFSIHYQWGFGRTMLMDLLNISTHFSYRELVGQNQSDKLENRKAIAERILKTSFGIMNFGKSVSNKNGVNENDQIHSYFLDDNKKYRETMKDVFDNSDNNDGYAKLDLLLSEYGTVEKGRIKLFDIKHNPVTLKEFSRSGRDFATPTFQKAFSQIASLYNIGINKFIEEEQKPNQDEEDNSTSH